MAKDLQAPALGCSCAFGPFHSGDIRGYIARYVAVRRLQALKTHEAEAASLQRQIEEPWKRMRVLHGADCVRFGGHILQAMKAKQEELLRKALQSLNTRNHQPSDSVLALPQAESGKADLPDGGAAPSWKQEFSASEIG